MGPAHAQKEGNSGNNDSAADKSLRIFLARKSKRKKKGRKHDVASVTLMRHAIRSTCHLICAIRADGLVISPAGKPVSRSFSSKTRLAGKRKAPPCLSHHVESWLDAGRVALFLTGVGGGHPIPPPRSTGEKNMLVPIAYSFRNGGGALLTRAAIIRYLYSIFSRCHRGAAILNLGGLFECG